MKDFIRDHSNLGCMLVVLAHVIGFLFLCFVVSYFTNKNIEKRAEEIRAEEKQQVSETYSVQYEDIGRFRFYVGNDDQDDRETVYTLVSLEDLKGQFDALQAENEELSTELHKYIEKYGELDGG